MNTDDGDQAMINRTLVANQRRLIAAIRALAVPEGYPVSTATVRNHLDAAIGQIEAIEALEARSDPPCPSPVQTHPGPGSEVAPNSEYLDEETGKVNV